MIHKDICALLEYLYREEVEQGIELGMYNARGAIWRKLANREAQERKLMEQYRSQIQALQARWPRTAEMLRRLAQLYQEEARMHDHEAS